MVNRNKINVNVTIFENSGNFSFGGVVRDYKWSFIAAIFRCQFRYIEPEIFEAVGVREMRCLVG